MKKVLAHFFLISESNVGIKDRISYLYNVIINFAPVAFILKIIDWWWSDNQQFGNFMCIALVVNMGVGTWYHLKNKSFSFKSFIIKNLEMCALVIVGYVMLEMLRYTAGDNFAGEIFKITIQITTLLFPTSKVLKNIYIMSNGKYPPEFFMKRLYNFEKNGDLDAFFKNQKNDTYKG